MAHFEYAIGVIFEQKAEEDYTLATIETPEENLKLVPIIGLFKFQFPIRKFYSEFKSGLEPSLPTENESYCVVLRHQFKLAVYDLHKAQYEFLNLLKGDNDIVIAKTKFKTLYEEENFEFETVWELWKNRWIEANFFKV